MPLIEEQQESLSGAKVCCASIPEITFVPLGDEHIEKTFDLDGEIVEIDGERVPVLGFSLKKHEENSLFQFMSFSDRKRQLKYLNRLTFIRPNVIFMDDMHQQIEKIVNPQLCWGHEYGVSGAWQRFDIPTGTAHVAIYPTVEDPIQPIDTRVLNSPHSSGVVGDAIISSISDARKTYHVDIGVGHFGLIAVELVGNDEVPLGHCRFAHDSDAMKNESKEAEQSSP